VRRTFSCRICVVAIRIGNDLELVIVIFISTSTNHCVVIPLFEGLNRF
jgi:hypothetical protein